MAHLTQFCTFFPEFLLHPGFIFSATKTLPSYHPPRDLKMKRFTKRSAKFTTVENLKKKVSNWLKWWKSYYKNVTISDDKEIQKLSKSSFIFTHCACHQTEAKNTHHKLGYIGVLSDLLFTHKLGWFMVSRVRLWPRNTITFHGAMPMQREKGYEWGGGEEEVPSNFLPWITA